MYHFETLFSPQKCEANPDLTLQTGTCDCEVSSHQVKSSPPKITKLFQFQTSSLPQFSMAVARCYNYWNLNTSSVHNARQTGIETSSAFNLKLAIQAYYTCIPGVSIIAIFWLNQPVSSVMKECMIGGKDIRLTGKAKRYWRRSPRISFTEY